MLLAIDVISTELIKIDIPRKIVTIGSYERAKALLLVRYKDRVRFRTAVIVR